MLCTKIKQTRSLIKFKMPRTLSSITQDIADEKYLHSYGKRQVIDTNARKMQMLELFHKYLGVSILIKE